MTAILTDMMVTNGKTMRKKTIAVDGGLIKSVGGPADAIKKIDLRKYIVMPGFIDIHAHGGGGHDAIDATVRAVNGISEHKIKEGVTTFCPATMTADFKKIKDAVRAAGEAQKKGTPGAKVAGVFIEGPYINPQVRGAHPLEHIRGISLKEIESLLGLCGGVRSILLSPELPDAVGVIAALRQKNTVVRIGHSSAEFFQANEAIAAGASVAVHTYNAMRPLNHREPGIVGAVLNSSDVYCEIICDLVHVHPAMIKILLGSKGARKTVLVTDSMRAAGLPDGTYDLGGETAVVKDGVARNKDGALAGSTTTLAACVKNMCISVGASLADAVMSATESPARALGIFDGVGSIEEGKCADIIALDKDLNVKFVMVGGEVKLRVL